VLQALIPNEGDAWRYTIDQVKQYFERALAAQPSATDEMFAAVPPLELVDRDPPPLVTHMIGAYLETARLLGLRTAELHQALASNSDDPQFAPEPFTTLYQRSLYQSMRNLTTQAFRLLRDRFAQLPDAVLADAESLLGMEQKVLDSFHVLLERRLSGKRIRCHGDYHLGQVLYTGKDFVIIDFEGEPARPLSQRRLRQSPLRDVAGMLRSFDYAVLTVLTESPREGILRPEDVRVLTPWADFWRAWVESAFLRAYLQHVQSAHIVPVDRAELDALLSVLLLEKAIYEVVYELNHRPSWIGIPVHGVRELVQRRRSG
jgi:maltose alpha-D-glucosyltransferase/alpha-amylase